MADFKRVPSSLFRVAYVTERYDPIAVTVLGRVIAFYIPVGVVSESELLLAIERSQPTSHEAPEADELATPLSSPSGAVDALKPTTGMTQAAKDRVLTRVANSRKGTS